jgi:hypothetical protein
MVRNGPKLEKKQATLFRAVDIGADLFAMAAAVSRARQIAKRDPQEGASAGRLADLFCRDARRRVLRRFEDLSSNDDPAKYRLAREILDGEHEWLERGIAPVPAEPIMAVESRANESVPGTPVGA